MKKTIMVLSIFLLFALLAMSACNRNNDVQEQITSQNENSPVFNENHSVNEINPQQELSVGQTDVLNKIRDPFVAGLMEQWSDELSMTLDEIFDYILKLSGFEYLFDLRSDVSSLTNTVGVESSHFIDISAQAYTFVRLIDVVNGWSEKFGMTIEEMMEYHAQEAFGTSRFADELGLEVDEFKNVLINVSTAINFVLIDRR